MKQINFFRKLFVTALVVGVAGYASAQIHPLAFGSYTLGTAATQPNWYADYVGLRFEVVTPLAAAGDKAYTVSNDGTGATTEWGGIITTPIVNQPIVMPQPGDSLVNTIITVSMTGKIGFVYRGGGVEFGAKALACQNAGAIACVIVNNIPGGPVGMGAGASGSSVTIPTFMISKADGDLLDSFYNAGIIPTLTITTWGQGNHADLGFVPNGAAMWHANAVPASQLGATGNPTPYNMLDGAFIANYGSSTITGVKLKSTTTFTPTGGSAGAPHSSQVDLASFPSVDSIWALFNTTEYSLSAGVTGTVKTHYVIESDSIDQFPADNTLDVTVDVSDNVFSKSRYDFVNDQPIRTIYTSFGGGVEFLWGPMYYVANSGFSVSNVKFSLAINSTTISTPLPSDVNVFVFKWTDGVGGDADSIVANGELYLVGSGTKHVDGINDTSGALLVQTIYADTNGNNVGPNMVLDGSSWYYVAIDVPSATFLGCDGVQDPYPRVYGRYHANMGGSGNHLLDYSSIEFTGSKVSLDSFEGSGNAPVPAFSTAYINSVDSFVYSNMKGLIPSVSMQIMSTTSNPVAYGKPLANVSLFPNPAKDQLNVTAAFDKNEKTVSYEIIDGLARFVSKDTHYNVQNDSYTINTSKLAPGNYYLIINAEGRAMTRRFTVVK